jgi:hypothetical protein
VPPFSWFVRTPGRAAAADAQGESAVSADESLFEGLQDVLRIAVDCPPGESGDGIRRGACELIEAHSPRDRSTKRRRLLNAIARVQDRRSRGRSHRDDPSAALLHRLSEALRRG